MGYPSGPAARDRWILERRGPKAVMNGAHATATAWEEEAGAGGALVPTAVVFLTNRECPFRCVMCDLWLHTLDTPTPPGAVVAQIREALSQLAPARQIKLYNAGSFFDPAAIPPSDDGAIAETVSPFERVIVEAHPAFLEGPYAERCRLFRDRLVGRLEVAVGLETAHPAALAQMNKRMTLDDFTAAADFLMRHGIALRTFVLLNPPFVAAESAVEWACRSVELAMARGATAISVIPTRGGNGALESLGDGFVSSRLRDLETVIEYGLALGRARVFADLWGIERFFDCACAPFRGERLRLMNRTQRPADQIRCDCDVRR